MAVVTLVMLTVMLGFAALTIDVGAAMNTRNDLQDSADAAALSAVDALTTDLMMSVRLADTNNIYTVVSDGTSNAIYQASANPSLGRDTTILDGGEVNFGWVDLTSATSPVITSALPGTFNAATVTVHRTAESANGSVAAMFSRIFGNSEMEVSATATAAFDDRVAGFDPSIDNGMLPFSIHEDLYEYYINQNNDDYTYDPDTDNVTPGTDGVLEINLYPHNTVPGNFGALNIGIDNESVVGLEDQIENGVTAEQFEAETGSPIMSFVDEYGNPTTYDMTGNPGLMASLEDDIESREGQIVGYFLHDNVILEGSNATYTITRLVFGRVMDVRLNGNPNARGVFIQPATQVGGGVIVSPLAPSSGGLGGRIVLAR